MLLLLLLLVSVSEAQLSWNVTQKYVLRLLPSWDESSAPPKLYWKSEDNCTITGATSPLVKTSGISGLVSVRYSYEGPSKKDFGWGVQYSMPGGGAPGGYAPVLYIAVETSAQNTPFPDPMPGVCLSASTAPNLGVAVAQSITGTPFIGVCGKIGDTGCRRVVCGEGGNKLSL